MIDALTLDVAGYGALFSAAFLAATILPAQSEIGLALLIRQLPDEAFWLIAIASIGNIAGAMVNYYLGYYCQRFQNHKYFPLSPDKLTAASRWYERYGIWSLLLSWMPIIGDPITIAAGLMRSRFLTVLLLVSIAKTTRYLVIAWLVTVTIL